MHFADVECPNTVLLVSDPALARRQQKAVRREGVSGPRWGGGAGEITPHNLARFALLLLWHSFLAVQHVPPSSGLTGAVYQSRLRVE